MIGLRILEEQLARPVLMGFAMAAAIAPVVTVGLWLATSTTLSLASYVVLLIAVVIGLTVGYILGTQAQLKLFPAGLAPADRTEVLRTVWLGRQVDRRDLASAVIHYSQGLLKKRSDIVLLVAGAALVVLAVLPVPGMPATRQLIVLLVFAAGTFACYPSALLARKRQQTALKNAQELLATPVPVATPLGER